MESSGNSLVSPRKGLCLELEAPGTLARGAYLRMSPSPHPKTENHLSNPNVPMNHLETLVNLHSVSLGLDAPATLRF